MKQDFSSYLYNLVQLASYVCQTPTALISINDKLKLQYAINFDLDSLDWYLNSPFCSYTRSYKSLFVVENAPQDSRFAEHLLVKTQPHIHFYAGAPLISLEGKAIGTLCVIDYKARTLNLGQQKVLELLAHQVVMQLEAIETIESQAKTLQQKYEQLQEQVTKLKHQNLVSQLLNQLAISLQTCVTFEEAYRVIAPLLAEIFPTYSGHLLLVKNKQNSIAQSVLQWGKWFLLPLPNEISLQSCQVLEFEGEDFLCSLTSKNQRCACPQQAFPKGQKLFCFPLKDEDGTLGLLHLCSKSEPHFSPIQDRFVWQVVNLLTLAFKNLKLLDTLKVESIRDPLTGLFNRRYFNEILERLLSRGSRGGGSISLIMLDIDHFKRLNDTFGHPAGDTVLHDFSIFLKGNVRPNDIVCRYGGEEFALILPDCSSDVALQRAEKLRRSVKYLVMQHQGKRLGRITISLGIAVFPHHALEPSLLVEVADSALYQAKKTGRDRVCIASSATQLFSSPRRKE